MIRLLRPLVRAATYRRAVFLLLGAVLALPYLMAVVLFAQMAAEDPRNRAGVLALAAVAALIAAAPPFLTGTRELEIAAARALLDVDLLGHDRSRPPALETRLRTALWFAVHMLTGAVIGAVALMTLPVGPLALTDWLGFTDGTFTANTGWWVLAGVALPIAGIYACAGLGRLAATMAPVLLGPSPAQRLAELHERERQLAERNRLARELHDSVGHALTAMTLQAGAARAVFDSDPGFARQALSAIEETGRSAAGELDTVLGILRDEAAGRQAAPTLADLDRLLTGEVRAEVAAVDVPPQVSREAFRIVQESLTNAARHGAGPATLSIRQASRPPDPSPPPEAAPPPNPSPLPRAAPPPNPSPLPRAAPPPDPSPLPEAAQPPGEDELVIEVSNRRAAPAGGRTGGHGIDGMRERVRLLGGTLTAGPDGETWRVEARLPLPRTAGAGPQEEPR